jgi:hypothetical protein
MMAELDKARHGLPWQAISSEFFRVAPTHVCLVVVGQPLDSTAVPCL